MARFIGRTKDGQEIFASDMKDVEVKVLSENEIEMIGSTEHMDRDSEVLKIDGWDLKNFKKNPVILPAHMYWEPAIGRGKVSIEDKKLVFKIEFPPAGINPVADVYKGLYKGGFMKASSVGFIPTEWTWGEKEGDPRRTFIKQELLELSLVSVPSNPNAILTDKGIEQAVKAGKLRGHEIEVLKNFIKRCLDADPQRRKIFVLPALEVKDGDDKDPKPADAPAADPAKPEGDPKPAATPSDTAAQENEKLFKQMIDTAIAGLKAELLVEIKAAFDELKKSKKEHYIDDLLNGPGPDGPTEAQKLIVETGKALKDSFKLTKPAAK